MSILGDCRSCKWAWALECLIDGPETHERVRATEVSVNVDEVAQEAHRMRQWDGLGQKPKDTLSTRMDTGRTASKAWIEPAGDTGRRNRVRTQERSFLSRKRGANSQRSQVNWGLKWVYILSPSVTTSDTETGLFGENEGRDEMEQVQKGESRRRPSECWPFC